MSRTWAGGVRHPGRAIGRNVRAALHREPRPGRHRASRNGGRFLALVVVVAVLFGLAAWSAAPAKGDVVRVAGNRTLIVDAPVVPYIATIRTDTRAGGKHRASLWFDDGSGGNYAPIGWGVSKRARVTILDGRFEAWRLTKFGPTEFLAVDDAAMVETTYSYTVRVLRKSRAALTHAERRGRDVALAARVTHYQPDRDRYVGSNLSPVRFQRLTDRGWTTIGTGVTNRDGLAGATAPHAPGLYRVVRKTGATVTSAVSAPGWVR